ncbi:MAG TPA: PQQ-binding-like beta-propeller repeat protein [Verrucomicrobiae bacterium]|nr:PQQ-binding-like beta-propeller repeat protein [Verrucomicrobiae bacterium]
MPSDSSTSLGNRSPQYISTGMQSMRVIVYRLPYTGTVVETVIQNLTSTSPGCTTTSSGTACMLALDLAPGNYVSSVATFSSQNAHGTVLSIQYNVFFTVPNNGTGVPTVIPWSLYGVPEKLTMVPVVTPQIQTNGPNAVTLYSGSAAQFTLAAFDATGEQILGTGSPAWTGSSSNPGFTFTGSTSQNLNTVTIAPPASRTPSTTLLTVQASYPPDQTPTISSPCRQPKGVCSIVMTVNSLDVADDDWITFAHDYARSGHETQSTGLSTSNVSNLTLRWKVAVPNSYNRVIDPSPVVYNGNVVVVTLDGHVYDLSAINGAVLWSQQACTTSCEVIATPTIDPSAKLVFVSNRIVTSGSDPSYVYALNLKDGSVAWRAQVPGLTHAGPVVAGGYVYQGTSGSDPPQCLNTGVTALSELDGSLRWTWYVNSLHNPGGGGSAWGDMAFDGTRLIVGTGNTCQTPVMTANGAVALDLNGNLLWDFVAVADSYSDYDTGGGVMIANGNATFLNKNGTLYTLDAATGSVVRRAVVNTFTGDGWWASPTTDGATTLIGAGMFYCHSPYTCPTSASASESESASIKNGSVKRPFRRLGEGKIYPSEAYSGYVSYLRAVDSNGNILWSHEMTNGLEGYVAINNGLAFAGLDDSVGALDIGTGSVLWTAPTSGLVVASPVVVPSGVYAADESGNVYAFTLPYQTNTPSSTSRQPTFVGGENGLPGLSP